MPTDARCQAFFLLNKLDQRKHTLDYYLEELDRKALLTDRRERALFNALVYGVLRQRAWLDYVIKQFSSKPLANLDYEVLNVLRLALFQIIFMDKIPESAAVNTAVEITKKYKPKATGFVNAILRKSVAGYPDVNLPVPEDNLIRYLSIKHGLPQWLASRWLKRFGQSALEEIGAELNAVPPLSLRVNTLKTAVSDLAAKLQNSAKDVSLTTHATAGLNLGKSLMPVYELPGYDEGLFLVQDEAAQFTVQIVDPQPHETILDACAGIGGKTLSMAIAAHNQAQLVAADQTPAKLDRLKTESERLGLSPPATIAIDWLRPLPEIQAQLKQKDLPDQFDKVLVDAPCSGLGVLRRNPDTKWARRESDLDNFAKRQLAILQKAAFFVKNEGLLMYTVCSTEPEETVSVVEKFLENNSNFTIEKIKPLSSDKLEGDKSINNCYFNTYPLNYKMDGFFMARFKKQKRIQNQ